MRTALCIAPFLRSSILLLSANSVVAEPLTIQLPGDMETVSIATGASQPRVGAPAVATLITRQMIEESAARSIADILSMVPGFHIGNASYLGAPVFAVRGFTSSFDQNVLIMVNGAPQTEILFGDRVTSLANLPVRSIERVEVSRGPGSALFGSDAFSAVVNVVTREGQEHDANVEVLTGSDRTQIGRLTAATRLGAQSDVFATVEYQKTNGYDPTILGDTQTRLDQVMGTAASLAPGNALLGLESISGLLDVRHNNWRTIFRSSRTINQGLGGGLNGALDPYGKRNVSTADIHTKYAKATTSDWQHELDLRGFYVHSEFDNVHWFPAGAFGVFPDGLVSDWAYKTTGLQYSGSATYTGFDAHRLRLGFGGENIRAEVTEDRRNYIMQNGLIMPTGAMLNASETGTYLLGQSLHERDLAYVYIQDEWQIHSDWSLTYGLRYDKYSSISGVSNKRAALVWSPRHDLSVKLLYGEGFRAPTVQETSSSQIPLTGPSGNLKPERLTSYDLAFEYLFSPELTTGLNIFYNYTRDQIRQKNTPPDPSVFSENFGKQVGRGAELTFRWRPAPAWQIHGYYAYQDNEDELVGEDAGYAPHHRAYLMLTRRYGKLIGSGQLTYVGARDRVYEDTRKDADTYTLLNILLQYQVNSSLSVSMDVRNVFDTTASEGGFGTSVPSDWPLPGRKIYGSIKYSF